ncbi:MAG: plasmid pRiA4b ORF-3 family protein [Acidimicrobiales bacterium]
MASRNQQLSEELTEAIERTGVMARFEGLSKFYAGGRKLTQTGNPTLADARLLVDLLGLDDELDTTIGERTFRTRSAGELPELSFTVAWALRAGVLRTLHGRLLTTANWTRSPVADRFRRAIDALVSTGPLALRHGADRRFAALFGLVDDSFPAMLWRLAEGPLRIEDATRQLCAFLDERYEFRGWYADDAVRLRAVGSDLEGIAGILVLAGVATFDGPAPARGFHERREPEGAVALTEAGRWWLDSASLRRRSAFGYRPAPRRSETAHNLRISLDGSFPRIWRDVTVPSELSLGELHSVIQIAMGWQDGHLHRFEVGGRSYGEIDDETFDWAPEMLDEDLARLGGVAPRQTVLSYEYDFGDSWEHTISVRSVEAIRPLSPEAVAGWSEGAVAGRSEGAVAGGGDTEIPACTGGERACPPEDVGGIWGYKTMLEARDDPSHEYREQFQGWVSDDFDPGHFDLEAVNAALRQAFSARARALD